MKFQQRSLAPENYSLCSTAWHCLRDPMFNHFGRVPTFDRHEWTQGHSIYMYHTSIALHAKMQIVHSNNISMLLINQIIKLENISSDPSRSKTAAWPTTAHPQIGACFCATFQPGQYMWPPMTVENHILYQI